MTGLIYVTLLFVVFAGSLAALRVHHWLLEDAPPTDERVHCSCGRSTGADDLGEIVAVGWVAPDGFLSWRCPECAARDRK